MGGGGGSGRRTDVGFGSPFSSDIWDPLGLGFGGGLGLRPGAGGDDDVSALAHATVDWRETDKNHIFRVDIPGEPSNSFINSCLFFFQNYIMINFSRILVLLLIATNTSKNTF